VNAGQHRFLNGAVLPGSKLANGDQSRSQTQVQIGRKPRESVQSGGAMSGLTGSYSAQSRQCSITRPAFIGRTAHMLFASHPTETISLYQGDLYPGE
jgi:hypothetical protein